MAIPSEKLRQKWLEALLPLVEESGWSVVNAEKAAEAVGLSAGEQALAAPNGVTELIDQFFDDTADQMLIDLSTKDLGALRTHERVAAALRAWLDVLGPNREAVRKAAGRGMLPWGAGAATRRVWKVADTIWEAAGDTATDYNRQTKRGLLSLVIPSIVLKWLNSDDPSEVDSHIEARLKQAMALGQAGGKIVGPALDLMGRLKNRK
jgi:ubiquinone biosynthesis protein COQ9